MGLDCSTNSLAYATVENGKLIDYGEFFFEGSDIHRRLVDVRKKVTAHIEHFDVDYICLEQAVMVRNIQVAMKLSEFFGAIKSIILEGSDVYQVKPMEWQKGIGNPTIVGKEKVKWLKEHPQFKTKSQILNGIRQYRKQVTMDWVEKNYGLKADNDNISDAVAIAHYASSKLVK
jgi:Holliday junction resolvasome RuvABC endonuclease subunit